MTLLSGQRRTSFASSISQPGKPPQNALVERYSRTVHCDWFGHHLFNPVENVQEFATRGLWTYNHECSIWHWGGLTPKRKLAQANQLPLLSLTENRGFPHPGKRASEDCSGGASYLMRHYMASAHLNTVTPWSVFDTRIKTLPER